MLKLNQPSLAWGVAHWGTPQTQTLFTDETFTFKDGAEAYIRRIHEISENPLPENYAVPVLLKMTASLCSDDEARAYDEKQQEWMAKREAEKAARQKTA